MRLKAVCDPHPPWTLRHHPLLLHLPLCRKEMIVVSILATEVAVLIIVIANVSAVATDVTGITSARVAVALEALGTVNVVDRVLTMALTVDA
jgi:hypothetical protein